MTWQIDTAHSHIGFVVRHMMISKVRGKFSDFEGTIDFDQDNPEETVVDVTIDAASIDTGEEDRDNHLRSEDFLYVEKYPHITFKSKRVELEDEEHATLIGDLTIRGETHEVKSKTAAHGRIIRRALHYFGSIFLFSISARSATPSCIFLNEDLSLGGAKQWS